MMPKGTSSSAKSDTSGAFSTRAHITDSTQGTASWPSPSDASRVMSHALALNGNAMGKVSRQENTAPIMTADTKSTSWP